MIRHLFLVPFLALALTSCAKPKPSVVDAPSAPLEEKVWRTGYEWISPESDTPVLLVADYRHVLTTDPPTVYTAPPEPKIAPEEGEMDAPQNTEALDVLKEKPVEKSVLVIPPTPPEPQVLPVETHPESPMVINQAARPTFPAVKIVESPFARAWKRFCNNGEGMTDVDWQIVMDAKGEVPEKFRESCYPPK